MPDSPDFEDFLGGALDVIDRDMAQQGRALKGRPLWAANDFVRCFIVKVHAGPGTEETEPGEFMDYVNSEWFKVIYARTVAWYNERYGDAMKRESGRTLVGCILVLDVPFVVRVPVVTQKPGVPGETICVGFPDRVEDDEDALAWIVAGPNMAALPRGDGMKARRLANEVGGAIRAIHIGLGTVEISTDRVAELRDAILPHLDRAAIQIANSRPENLKHAQWDLQMACELALKLLAQQRAGVFFEGHNLYHLYDQLPPGRIPFARGLLSRLPDWQKMTKWRFGGGPPISIAAAFSRYRATLKIVQGTADAADRQYRMGGASIEIKRAPYLHEDPSMYLPRRERAPESPN